MTIKESTPVNPVTQVDLFVCYAEKDKEFYDKLEVYLASLTNRCKNISIWHTEQIQGGADRNAIISEKVASTEIFLFLITPNFLTPSQELNSIILKALELNKGELVTIIPIVMRDCLWQEDKLGHLQALPKPPTPLAKWDNEDDFFLSILIGVKQSIASIQARKIRILSNVCYWDATKENNDSFNYFQPIQPKKVALHKGQGDLKSLIDSTKGIDLNVLHFVGNEKIEAYKMNNSKLDCLILEAHESEPEGYKDWSENIIHLPKEINSKGSTAFFSGFYQKYSESKNVPEAFNYGFSKLGKLKEMPHHVPTLYGSSVIRPKIIENFDLKDEDRRKEAEKKLKILNLEIESTANQLSVHEANLELNSPNKEIICWIENNLERLIEQIIYYHFNDRKSYDKEIFENELELLFQLCKAAIVVGEDCVMDYPGFEPSFNKYNYDSAKDFIFEQVPKRVEAHSLKRFQYCLNQLIKNLIFKN